MTDTAIPLPDDGQIRLDEFNAAWRPLVEGLGRELEAAFGALQESMAAMVQHWTVATTMPELTMRQTMVHGYVPFKEAR